jgi:hypothetical protein
MKHEIQKSIELTDLLGSGPAQFRPIAYYDKHMDCIRIELRDCSITERRYDEYLTVLYDNYPEVNQHDRAGLMIKGVKYLFKEVNLPMEGILRVTEILNKLAQRYPQLIDTEISRIVTEIELTVNLDEVAAA